MTDANVCFFVTPIGDADSPQRKRSDTVLHHILEPALVPDIVDKVVRVDQDPRAGFITSTIIERITSATLVVADITGLNPNVFYELAIAHAARVPAITIGQLDEKIPFDISALNVIPCPVDIAGGSRAREDIATAARHVVEHPEQLESPVTRALLVMDTARGGDTESVALATILRRLEGLEAAIREPSSRLRSTRSRAGAFSGAFSSAFSASDPIMDQQRYIAVLTETETILQSPTIFEFHAGGLPAGHGDELLKRAQVLRSGAMDPEYYANNRAHLQIEAERLLSEAAAWMPERAFPEL